MNAMLVSSSTVAVAVALTEILQPPIISSMLPMSWSVAAGMAADAVALPMSMLMECDMLDMLDISMAADVVECFDRSGVL